MSKSAFNQTDTNGLIQRINKLTPATQPQWGKMNVAQMLAHCNVTYELVYDNKHPKPGAFKRFLLKAFVKNAVVGDKPYKRNSPTAPVFLVSDRQDFEKEKQRLISYINKTQQLGAGHFEGKESHSFGPLSAREWDTMFYKHLDHHLTQFGV
ncbi:DUF1569 domain-containing protein [Taibaiella soli]|uniref:DUF1569 domain-containing protein n=1 Tax=Taibaiella soli TaxID=1649169 RepID=A0A2W2BEW0_9BACT|nr:DUF1569 domain-containing protein [Taibaiella soli]PZF72106.1 hypothetical protein DN068_14315 [Taibaiella soli]